MGSNSRSQSEQATENNSTTFGIQGANNGLILNGSGNTITDGGAFEIVANIADMLPQLFSQGAGMVTDGFNAVADVAMAGERQTENVLDAANDLFLESNNTQREIARLNADVMTETGEILSRGLNEGYDFGRDAMDLVNRGVGDSYDFGRDAMDLVNRGVGDSYDFGRDAMDSVFSNVDTMVRSNTDISLAAMDNSSDLAENLTLAALNSNNETTQTTTRQLTDGFKDMMNFAEDFSRSDSVAAAKDSNKSLMYVGGGLTLVAVAIIMAKGKK
ncbi:hypothetical protein [Shewanella sp. YLB-07]|uniref:hypothetical protein n=1 Tax=Shewanella sp. YLB-07 TaxID=2601268 RepID=UPI00128C99AA|nr:hypothetical protein [Shewanella sp. YLB-07]MPY23921.1 hypothetical protein [Shewanella sp. YLB-07]